jgi:membrane protease YdiL (CAAX protease family)
MGDSDSRHVGTLRVMNLRTRWRLAGEAVRSGLVHSDASTQRRLAVAATAAVVVALAGVNVVKHLLPSEGVVLSVAAAAALLVFGRLSGLSWRELGLGREQLRSGHRWGWAAAVAVGAVYLAGLLLPQTRAAFLDSRYDSSAEQALMTAFVIIPLGTVLLEEVAFRSVLWGLLSRHMRTWGVALVSSALFGLWHILPSLDFAAANHAVGEMAPGVGATALVVAGTVLFTGAGGLVAAELRRRSGSVLASAGMHWATNGLGVLFGVLAWRMVGG